MTVGGEGVKANFEYNDRCVGVRGYMLQINDLSVEIAGNRVLQGVSLVIEPGSVHALMGANGSGKSTLAATIMGHPSYVVVEGGLKFDGRDLEFLTPDKRACLGIFLSLQQPYALPGVRVNTFLLEAYRALTGSAIRMPGFMKMLEQKMERVALDQSFLHRDVNDGFSGGEKKKFELLQMLIFKPKVAILDEIDSGLDIDALKLVTEGIAYAREQNPEMSVLIITHYKRMFEHVKPDWVHILNQGAVVATGDIQLIDELEHKGYDAFRQ